MSRKAKVSPTRPSAADAQEEGEIARKVWLAGVGAYGRALSEAQESISRFGAETSKMFEDLVRRGEEIEKGVEARRKDLSERMGASIGLPLQDRVNDMREKLKRHISRSDAARLAEIEERLTRIEQLLGADQRSTAPRKRRSSSATAGKAKSGSGA